jgi:predicted helicase
VTIGYVEAKDVGKSLDEAERSEQLKRYRRNLPNLILTDYLQFRWYVGDERRSTARLAMLGIGGKLSVESGGGEAVTALLGDFLSHKPQEIATPKELAERMARLTHMIRDIVVEAFQRDKASPLLKDLREAFAKALIPDLDQPEKTGELADMYAQTLAYGLFAARCNHKGPRPFRRLGAAAEIPKTNPLLRKLFETITGPDLDDEPYAGFVDDLVQVLAHSNMESILAEFGKRERQKDPVLHFYETFLATYDPKTRERRGVYYTPEPVVSYIVRSVDHLLRTRFGLPGGLADQSTVEYELEDAGDKPRKVREKCPRVLVLDPACGTATFLYAVVDLIREQFMQRGDAGMWSGYVREHLLPRLFGFELLMAPYAVAHLKLGLQLAAQDLPDAERKKWAYDFSGDERLGIYLTNTLEEAERRAETLFGPLRVITEEANAAAHIKRDLPILAVIGNPPYSGHSANRSWEMKEGKRVPTLAGRLVKDYYQVDGQPLGERNPKWLQDDYVKFIRWAQWRIERTGQGILAFITNHGYLDNPTFRGMRQHLMNSFTEIYILDLHGSSKKRERAPDGGKDENVFDIQQGVAIGILVKYPGKPGPATVHHAELWGSRESKYHVLSQNDVSSTQSGVLKPQSPEYLFVPRDVSLKEEFHKGWSVRDIFRVSSVGVVTGHDHLTIHWVEQEAWNTVLDFASLPPEEARAKYGLGKDVADSGVQQAQDDIRSSGPDRGNAVPILYRPFDLRFTYYTGQSGGFIGRPRAAVMRHMLAGKNLAVHVCRQTSIEGWRHVLATNRVTDDCYVSNLTSERGYTCPLYLYPPAEGERSLQKDFGQVSPWPAGEGGRVPNLNPEFVANMEAGLGLKFVSDGVGDPRKTFGPEDVFHYIYAVFHSPTYRRRYAEFLKIDFPRVPLTSNLDMFSKLCGRGSELVALHLLASPAVSQSITRYPVPGDNRVEKGCPKYVPPGEAEPGTGKPLKEGRVFINKAQYFEGVPPEVWEFQVGGYQPMEKWLKDRRGRVLSYDDRQHYQKVAVALKETIRLMAEIDSLIPRWPLT